MSSTASDRLLISSIFVIQMRFTKKKNKREDTCSSLSILHIQSQNICYSVDSHVPPFRLEAFMIFGDVYKTLQIAMEKIDHEHIHL